VALKDRILADWAAILDIAAAIPDAAAARKLPTLAGCPTALRAPGFSETEVAVAIAGAY
jgi:hypothetical protein